MKKISNLQKRKNNENSKYWQKKALAEWSNLIRIKNKCEICGSKENLQAHHIFSKNHFKKYKYHPKNGICLCSSCHRFGRFSAHGNGIFFSHFLSKHFPRRWAWANDVVTAEYEAHIAAHEAEQASKPPLGGFDRREAAIAQGTNNYKKNTHKKIYENLQELKRDIEENNLSKYIDN